MFDDTRGTATCRSCSAPVTWFQLTTGKRHPFDGEPVYVQTEHDQDRRLIGHIDTSVNKSHFATCPDAKEWRQTR